MSNSGVLRFLFPSNSRKVRINTALLVARMLFAIVLGYDGIFKAVTFSGFSEDFPNPLGIGSVDTAILFIVVELVCALLVLLGVVTRLAAIPVAFIMLIAFSDAQGDYGMGSRYVPILFCAFFLQLLFTGAGRYSIDQMIHRNIKHHH